MPALGAVSRGTCCGAYRTRLERSMRYVQHSATRGLLQKPSGLRRQYVAWSSVAPREPCEPLLRDVFLFQARLLRSALTTTCVEYELLPGPCHPRPFCEDLPLLEHRTWPRATVERPELLLAVNKCGFMETLHQRRLLDG